MGAYTIGQAQLEFFKLESEANALDKTDMFTWLTKQGLPVTVTLRLEDLWDTTKKIAGQVVHLGKIIFLKLLEFIKAHPCATIGLVLGAAIGALVSLVPFIGPLLAPIVASLGAAYGFVVGCRLDHPSETQSTFEGLICTAKDFFQLFAELVTMIFSKYKVA